MNATVKDYQEITTVLTTYLEGGNKNSAAMKPAFHVNAVVNAQPAPVWSWKAGTA